MQADRNRTGGMFHAPKSSPWGEVQSCVPTHAEELTARYDEHDMQPVEAGDGLPAGTYTTFYRCRLIAADGGWYGEILGNGSW